MARLAARPTPPPDGAGRRNPPIHKPHVHTSPLLSSRTARRWHHPTKQRSTRAVCHGGGDSEDISYRKRYSQPPKLPSLMSVGAPAPSRLVSELLSLPVSTQRGCEGTGERSREEKDPAPTLTAPTPFPPTPSAHSPPTTHSKRMF